jgi:hypothetical protein
MEADKPYFRIFERNELYIRMSRQHLKGIFGGIRLLGGTRPSAPPISAFMFKYIVFLYMPSLQLLNYLIQLLFSHYREFEFNLMY